MHAPTVMPSVDDEHARIAPPQARVRARGVAGAQDLPDRPRLAAHLGRDPAALDRDNGQRAGDHREPQEPAVVQQIMAAPAEAASTATTTSRQQRADADHRLEGQMRDVDRRPVGRDGIQPGDRRVEASCAAMIEPSRGISSAQRTSPSISTPPNRNGAGPSVVSASSNAASLAGWVSCTRMPRT